MKIILWPSLIFNDHTGDIYTCNAYGWAQQTLQTRTFDFEDYDDSTPSLPLPDCAGLTSTNAKLADLNVFINRPREKLRKQLL